MLPSPIIAAFSACQSVFPNACCRIRIERGKRLNVWNIWIIWNWLANYTVFKIVENLLGRAEAFGRVSLQLFTQALVFGAIRANTLLVNPSIVTPML